MNKLIHIIIFIGFLILIISLYKNIETFEDFVKEQNFLDILLSYKPNKLPTENYKRFSKILISNSDDFFQQQSKLNFEFIALNSPFDKRNEFRRRKIF